MAELDSGQARPGLWAKAFTETDGDEPKAKALYIKLRVQAEREKVEQDKKAREAAVEAQGRQEVTEIERTIEDLRKKGYEAVE